MNLHARIVFQNLFGVLPPDPLGGGERPLPAPPQHVFDRARASRPRLRSPTLQASCQLEEVGANEDYLLFLR